MRFRVKRCTGRGIRTGMPQNMLQSTEVQAKLQQMGSVAMPQSMHMDLFGNTGVLGRQANGRLNAAPDPSTGCCCRVASARNNKEGVGGDARNQPAP